jgi:hypothetical protein
MPSRALDNSGNTPPTLGLNTFATVDDSVHSRPLKGKASKIVAGYLEQFKGKLDLVNHLVLLASGTKSSLTQMQHALSM